MWIIGSVFWTYITQNFWEILYDGYYMPQIEFNMKICWETKCVEICWLKIALRERNLMEKLNRIPDLGGFYEKFNKKLSKFFPSRTHHNQIRNMKAIAGIIGEHTKFKKYIFGSARAQKPSANNCKRSNAL